MLKVEYNQINIAPWLTLLKATYQYCLYLQCKSLSSLLYQNSDIFLAMSRKKGVTVIITTQEDRETTLSNEDYDTLVKVRLKN